MRADVYLTANGLASSRNKAQELIEGGRVYILIKGQRRIIQKASFRIDASLGPDFTVHVEDDGGSGLFVSRGGLKMQGALIHTQLQVKDFAVLDIGISTGGFSDCLLQAGARTIVGVDVGHGQLAAILAKDPRVRLLEGVNARELTRYKADILLAQQALGGRGSRFDLIVLDVSFISLTLVLPEVIQYLKDTARVLALVKPQFEVGREGLGKNGIVKDPARYQDVETKIRTCCESLGLNVEDYFESSIEGSDGNREFFIFASHRQLTFL